MSFIAVQWPLKQLIRVTTCHQCQFLRWKGHSKWQNIKATKAAKDEEYNRKATKHAYEIATSVKENSFETNPEVNKSLAR